MKMRFWSGLLLSLFGGLLGIGLFREWILLRFPNLCDYELDIISLLILMVGLIISSIDHLIQSNDLKKLQNEQIGRVLKQKDKENLKDALKIISKIKVELTSIQGDRETYRFANELKDLLVESNWEVEGVWEDIIIGGAGSGVMIRENSTSENSTGKALNKMLNENNIKTRLVIKSDMKENLIEIIVGSRP